MSTPTLARYFSCRGTTVYSTSRAGLAIPYATTCTPHMPCYSSNSDLTRMFPLYQQDKASTGNLQWKAVSCRGQQYVRATAQQPRRILAESDRSKEFCHGGSARLVLLFSLKLAQYVSLTLVKPSKPKRQRTLRTISEAATTAGEGWAAIAVSSAAVVRGSAASAAPGDSWRRRRPVSSTCEDKAFQLLHGSSQS